MAKTDSKLGQQIHEILKALDIETPTLNTSHYTKDEQLELIAQRHGEIMQILGLDLKDDSLQETPQRIAKMYVNEIFEGLDYENFPKCTTVSNKFRADEMLIEKGIDVLREL